MGIRENLTALMAHRKISQYALAAATGVPQPTIQRILTGDTADPRTPTVARLAKFFGVSVEELRGTQSGLAFKEPPGVTEEAMEIARLWMSLPAPRRQAIRDNLFLIAAAAKFLPWLNQGKPSHESYEDFEERLGRLVAQNKPVPRKK